MNGNFAPNVLKAASYAQEEASSLGHAQVAPIHVLLGFVRLTDDPPAALLRDRAVTLPLVVRTLDTLLIDEPGLGKGLKIIGNTEKSERLPVDKMPFDAAAKKLLHTAWQKSQDDDMPECNTEHLLCAILELDEEELTTRVLRKLEVTLDERESKKLLIEIREKLERKEYNQDIETLKRQIIAWHTRAAMAEQAGNETLAKQAMDIKAKYEELLRERLEE